MTEGPQIKNENKATNNAGQVWWQPAMIIGGQIIGWIAGPLILSLFIGQWLDEKYGSEPKFLLISVGIAFVLSNVGIILNTLKAAKDLEKLDKKKDGKPDTNN